jgi:hypothetical protein
MKFNCKYLKPNYIIGLVFFPIITPFVLNSYAFVNGYFYDLDLSTINLYQNII